LVRGQILRWRRGSLMQKLPLGTIVRVRRGRWRVADVRAYDDCQLVTVTSVASGTAACERRFLIPFDSVHPIARRLALRGVRRSTWRRACRSLAADDTPPGRLRTAARATIDLLPYQLAPALAVVRGRGCRLLLADEVGLGKTIQAGLIVSELRDRDAVDRVLVLTPAALRDQWRAELRDRFAIDAVIADAQTVRSRTTMLPAGVNPWTTWPIAIASLDYVKRPEVLAAVARCRWDLVIVDEAHGAATDSDRHHAASALAARASYVVLVTATPHNGNPQAFDSLCGIGGVGDERLLVFQRTRADAGLASRRRVHTLAVTPTAAERRMHRLLQRYTEAVLAERADAALAVSVLHKRASSSAWALAESVDRRLAASADVPPSADEQLALPLDQFGELTADDEAPAWPADVRLADPDRDRRLLRSLASAARAAARDESKIAAIARWLRRVPEPAIVFTEYRDTLRHVAAHMRRRFVLLHGGLNADERRGALAEFRRGPDLVLLATDAAGEGLNLHDNCRIAINLELPWNPVRLEQRIGRVDRIGQRRPVHALLLIAAGTGEASLLERLDDRIAIARDAVRGAEPAHADLAADVAMEAHRLEETRALTATGDDRIRARLDVTGPWITTARRRWRRRLGPTRIELWRIAAEDGDGRLVASTVFALAIDRDHGPIADALAIASRVWRDALQNNATSFARARLTRERAIAATLNDTGPRLFQPGLFDRRRDRAQLIADVARAVCQQEIDDRAARVRRQQAIAFRPPELLLVCSSAKASAERRLSSAKASAERRLT
jgi:superfamily II DNA or RNA helicase